MMVVSSCEDLCNLDTVLPYETPWVAVDQVALDKFADSTGDHQWIHVDPERAKAESPFGTTIAHGFFTLSPISQFLGLAFNFPDDVEYQLRPQPSSVRLSGTSREPTSGAARS